VIALFRRALHVGQVFLRAVAVDFLLGHLPLVMEVGLVADEEEDGIFLCVGFDLVHPELADVLKAELICEIEDKEDALAASVICAGDGSEAFLAGGIPNLELDVLGVDLDGFEAKVDADGGEVVF
jgi:hypothetical protein